MGLSTWPLAKFILSGCKPAEGLETNGNGISDLIARLLILIARGWQLGPSRILPPTCRYSPSCSGYAITALQKYGAIKGGWLTLKRLMRCQPWGGHGHDPVP